MRASSECSSLRSASFSDVSSLQADVDDCLLRATRPKKDGVDGVRRALCPNVSQAEIEIFLSRRLFDRGENVLNQFLGDCHASAVGSIDSQPELRRCSGGKNLFRNVGSDEHQHQEREDGVRAQEAPRECASFAPGHARNVVENDQNSPSLMLHPDPLDSAFGFNIQFARTGNKVLESK